MGASEQRQKSSKMASDMVKKGIWHGRHMTSPTHNNYPVNEPGSAAYRRLMRSKKGRSTVSEREVPMVKQPKKGRHS